MEDKPEYPTEAGAGSYASVNEPTHWTDIIELTEAIRRLEAAIDNLSHMVARLIDALEEPPPTV